jgi:tripartite-type tricarboxylate transporter receptor subunit TctC
MKPIRSALAFLLFAATCAQAQSWPARPVKLIVPFPPGGSTDILARALGHGLSSELAQAVIIDNRPGAGGSIGAEAAAKAPPDGYTVMMGHLGTLAVNPGIYKNLPYDPVKSFAPVCLMAIVPSVLVVNPSLPVHSVSELIEYAKKNPGKLAYGTAGLGTNSFFTMELLKLTYGLDMTHVPFGGSGPVKNAVLGGHVQVGAASLSPMLSVLKSGDVVALAISATKRIPTIPNVPTMTEKGQPDASLSTWAEIYAPAKTPKAVVDRLAQALEKTMKDPAVVVAIEKAGLIVEYHGPEETLKLIQRENEIVTRLAKQLNLGK